MKLKQVKRLLAAEQTTRFTGGGDYAFITSTILVDNEVSQIDGIEILFHDKKVNTVVISNIKLWNGGNGILEELDFYPENELKIVVPESERILAAMLIEETDDTCN